MKIPRIINSEWKNRQMEKMNNALNPPNEFFNPVVTGDNMVAKWLIATMASRGLAPKVEQLGAGVKRIGADGQVCPTCGKKI